MPRRSAAALPGGHRSAFAVLAVLVIGVLAACGSSAVAPTGAPAPTTTARPSAAGSSPPAALAKPDPGATAVKGFVGLVTQQGSSYQAPFTGQSRPPTAPLPI